MRCQADLSLAHVAKVINEWTCFLTPQYAFSFTFHFANCVQLLYDISCLKNLKAVCQEEYTSSNLNFICFAVTMQTQRQGYLDNCQLWKYLHNNFWFCLQ